MRPLHAHAFRQLTHFTVAQYELLLQVGAFELLARLAQRQGQQILLDEWFIKGSSCIDLSFDFVQRDVLAASG